MNRDEYIPVAVFCKYHNVSVSFITSLHELGLIGIVVTGEITYMPLSELVEAERIIRLHNDLEINKEGIAVVVGLLQRINTMQNEITMLKNRLELYEENLE